MYIIRKKIEIAGAHWLELNYSSKCKDFHGHNWEIDIYCKAEKLNENGVIVDFSKISEIVKKELDHKNLNEVLPFNPTAENIAKYLCDKIEYCFKVEIKESFGNWASYEKI